MSVTYDDALAKLTDMGRFAKHEVDHFVADCPVCHESGVEYIPMRVYGKPGGIARFECDGGTPADHVERAIAEHVSSSIGTPAGLFSGAPMDPWAEPPEPYEPVTGFPFLYPGAAAVLCGPTGAGRSFLVQACAYDASKQGARVAYIGSEVRESEFNARARTLVELRGDERSPELAEALARVRYMHLPDVMAVAWDAPELWRNQIHGLFDVVLIDPLSSVASVAALNFADGSQDFVTFYDRLIQPLADAGRSVLMLDNIGHGEKAQRRPPGSAAKSHKPDICLWSRRTTDGLMLCCEKARSDRAPFERLDQWFFDKATRRVVRAGQAEGETDPLEATRRAVLEALASNPGLNATGLREVRGASEFIDEAIKSLMAEGKITMRPEGRAHRYYLLPVVKAA